MNSRAVSLLNSEGWRGGAFDGHTDTGVRDGGYRDAESSCSPPLLEQIINAVLYEGYILYPYRASSQIHQRERFTFGRIYPKLFSDRQNGAEPHAIQAECLVQKHAESAKLEITAGFLQPLLRQIGRLAGPEIQPVAQLEAQDKIYQTGLEAVENKVPVTLGIAPQETEIPFTFDSSQHSEPIRDADGRICGVVQRQRELLEGMMTVRVQSLSDHLFKVSVRLKNDSPLSAADLKDSENVLRRCFAATHVAFHVENGRFISLLDVPPEFEAFADGCKNKGVWPVLIGDEDLGEQHTMLASPIILYDYPRIAPESAPMTFRATFKTASSR